MKKIVSPILTLLFIVPALLVSDTLGAQTFYPIDSMDNGLFEATPSGGAQLQNFDCTDANPCYWFSTGGESVVITFTSPQDQPAVRVWGMNDDDIGSVLVNEAGYPLSSSTASYSDKVICNTSLGSPGPDGILFDSGGIVGANTNSEGNWSYQDLTLLTDGVESITVTSLGGAGWGVSGVVLGLSSGLNDLTVLEDVSIYPRSFTDQLMIDEAIASPIEVFLYDLQGQVVLQDRIENGASYSLGHLGSGIYVIELVSANTSRTERLVKY